MSNEHMKIRKGLLFTPQPLEPSNPVEGDMYFDSVIGLRLYKNGVWQTAGGQGEVKVALVDRVSTVLPTVDPAVVDSENVVSGDKVLFTNLSAGNNRVYRATVTGPTVSWQPQPEFSGQFDPTEADVVRVVRGGHYCLSQFIFKGTLWQWGRIDYCAGEATLGDPLETWGTAYIDDIFAESINVTTNVGAGDVVISGTEKLLISADGGAEVSGTAGLNVSGGLTQTKSIAQLFTVQDIDEAAPLGGSIGLTGGDGSWYGQSFTPTQSGDLTEIRVAFAGFTVSAGTLILNVYSDDGGGLPNVLLGQSDAIPFGSLAAGIQAFPFSSPIALTSGTLYHFQVNDDSLTGTYLMRRPSDQYANGTAVNTNDGGSSFALQAGFDLNFQTDLEVTTFNPNIRLNAGTSGYLDLLASPTTASYQLRFPSIQGTSGQLITNDGSGNLSWQDPILGFNAWTVVNSNTLADAFDDLGVETAGGPVDVTLPDTPANGSRVRVIDRNGDFATNSCFIKTTDGSTIEGIAQPLEIDVAYIWAEFVYDAAANNWAIYGPLAKGEALTLQDAYDGDIIANPVTITTNASQGDLSISGTEKFRVSAAKGVKIMSNTPSGIVIEVVNSGTDQTAVFSNTNAGNANAVLEISNAGSGNALEVSGSTELTGGLLIADGSEGTVGHVWTSSAIDGSGGWAALPAPPVVTLQSAYVGGETITTDAGNGDVTFAGTEQVFINNTKGLSFNSFAGNWVSSPILGLSGGNVEFQPTKEFIVQTSGVNPADFPYYDLYMEDGAGRQLECLLAMQGATANEIALNNTMVGGVQSRLDLLTYSANSEADSYARLQRGSSQLLLRTNQSALTGNGNLAINTAGNAAVDANPTGSLSLVTGDKTAGTGDSGSINITTGTSSGGARGKVKLVDGSEGTIGHVWTSSAIDGTGGWAALPVTDISGKADVNLGNLSATAVNTHIVPAGNGAQNLGGTSNRWNNLYVESINNPTEGLAIITSTANAGATTNTGGVSFLTGNQTGTGNSGGILFQTGSAAGGTRGKIRLVDGTEGTIGHIWTSSATNGTGEWAAPAAKSLQDAYNAGKTIAITNGGADYVSITGASGDPGEGLRVNHAGTATSAHAIRAISVGGVALRATSASYGLYIDTTGSDSAAHISSSGSGRGLNISQSGATGTALESTKSGASGVNTYINSTNAANASALLQLHSAHTSNGYIRMIRPDSAQAVNIRPDNATDSYTLTLPPTAGADGDSLHNTGSGVTSWKRSGWVTSTVAGAGPHAPVDYDEMFVDTSGAGAVVNMATAAKGVRVRLVDDQGTWAINNVTVNGNGGDTFDGVAGPLTLNINSRIVELIGDTGNWRVVVLK